MYIEAKDRVRSRLDELGISAREASRRIGAGVGWLGDFLEGRSKNPDVRRILALAEELELEPQELGLSAIKTNRLRSGEPFVHGSAGMMPLYAARIAMVGKPFLELSADPVGQVAPLPALEHVPGAYCFTIPNEMNEPRYKAGELVYISPAAPPRPGDFVFIRLVDGRGGVTRLDSITESEVHMTCIGARDDASRTHVCSIKEIEHIHRVVGSVG